ncbi:TSUP family transporter [Halioxenophilus sp. WMMB6]|uniref:TSUP family transporter n=1 Tax=Halioxenophilus sp. WMMB6 TaxID=3073815 RepID=UPI00295E6092|nr:TSUP family transporter [Halioxenophilus sp. WMMB6]
MSDLSLWQLVLIGLIFVWSGVVRSGLGFGGSVMALPFLLLILNKPLVFLPIISVHLLVFAGLTVWQNNRQLLMARAGERAEGTVDWGYLRRALAIMLVPKLVGVFGVIVLPNTVMTAVIYTIIAIYSITYVLNKPLKSKHPWVDVLFLMLGGYISGTSLVGAPLIIAVFVNHVAKQQLRDTLFVLWIVLVSIKMTAFLIAGVDLQLIHHLWLLPCAAVGHLFGLKLHRWLINTDTKRFMQVLGVALLVISGVGLWQSVKGGLWG